MHFGQASYLVTTAIVAGGVISIEVALSPKRLWRWRRIIGVTMLMGLIAAMVGEPIALAWRIWAYNPERTLNARFLGAEVETYLYVELVAIAVSSATLVWARYEEQGWPLIVTTFGRVMGRLNRLRQIVADWWCAVR